MPLTRRRRIQRLITGSLTTVSRGNSGDRDGGVPQLEAPSLLMGSYRNRQVWEFLVLSDFHGGEDFSSRASSDLGSS